jgi:hypothetical protein
MSAHRLAPLAACLGMLVALASASPAVAGTPGGTIRIVNQTGDVLGNGSSATVFGIWSVTPPPTLTTTSPGNVGTAVAASDSQGRFLGSIVYGPDNLQLVIQADTGPQDPFGVNCSSQNQYWTCSVENATSATPWVVNLLAKSNDRTRPAVRVRAPSSLAEESLRESGLPVVVRSNEPGRARIKLIARRGARHAAVARTLRWAGRGYSVKLRLNRAGRRAVQMFDVYTLRVAVADRAGNWRTVNRRVVIR